ncbi:FAD-dependent oxidoreductase [Nocardioides sp.]|uniref:FAD-dependent oxidoreductase n=1 Tax=Nocardioides sp. TaxID=35761 RepID=UPI002727CB64|nr:FAD-dependent oxidoreductase [Nocardioides sp.]MDO9455282.1 FAD-dependent oxidoreductase [Nocardioides sp.]
MAYVVTQSCCADASCVIACPVNCIHPAPGEPGFAEAEMLYVDATACVGCGACATACPVDAIKPDTVLTPDEQPFVAINADYFDCFPHPVRTPLSVVAKQRRLTRRGPFRVAVVGAGPAGLYTADELLKHPEVSVDVYDRLPTPYGLVRAGVAPDHHHTKRVEKLFRAIEEQPGFRYFLGVEIGRDLTLADLEAQYDAVVYSVGASADRSLGIEGEQLPGSLSATDLVGWYNGHPDKVDLDVPLDGTSGRAVVVGNGNVALDVARILALDPAALEHTDIAALPWAALCRSNVREVVVLGRRGPADAAFTLPELVGLAGLAESGAIDVVVDTGGAPPPTGTRKLEVLAELAARPARPARPAAAPGVRRIVLRFHTTPVRIAGDDRVRAVEVVRDGTTEVIEADLVLRAIGYHGRPVADLPYDAATGTVPHVDGRVRPGLYVAGWVKRGPTGFIGTNKSCAEGTVAAILDDLDAGLPTPVGSLASIASVVAGRCPAYVDLAGWRAIDAEERRRGERRSRPRAKIVDVDEMARVARAGTTPTPRRGYPSLRRLVRGFDGRT